VEEIILNAKTLKFSATDFTIEFLKANPERKFSSLQIARGIIDLHPEEAQAKSRKSKNQLDERSLLLQVQAEISSKRFVIPEKEPRIQIIDGKPMLFVYSTTESTLEKTKNPDFKWTQFYQELANELRKFKNDREALIKIIVAVADENSDYSLFQDTFADGSRGVWKDVCPFTVMGIFNRQMTSKNRQSIAKTLAKHLGVKVPVPENFDGVPLLQNQSSWFFEYEKRRLPGDIDKLWNLFDLAIAYSDKEKLDSADLYAAFDLGTKVKQSKWKLTFGLYWIRPFTYFPLDVFTRNYLEIIGVSEPIPNSPVISGDAYFELRNTLEEYFATEDAAVTTFPELAYAAWEYGKDRSDLVSSEENDDDNPSNSEYEVYYDVNSIIEEGCFVEESDLQNMLDILARKRNLILQGPPGTGKTWLAKRLAYVLQGKKTPDRVVVSQFHENMSYEDFIRGYRPDKDGSLRLIDGPFMDLVKEAKLNPSGKFVFVIEELNRGNPAQIFGEMLTLLEADKRNASEALKLTYQQDSNEKVYIPDNLYVVGTMNLADRSLAIMDFAFRRRFGFVNLRPNFGSKWKQWLEEHGLKKSEANNLASSISAINEDISNDPELGHSYCIGHSFFTPTSVISDYEVWVRRVVSSELEPTLSEYWFDRPDIVSKHIDHFLIQALA
jgi:5-methylcytosine-specific restriction protein B